MENKGWIKLYRKTTENSFCAQNSERLGFWVFLLTLANHKENTFMIGSQNITIQRGQFLTGRMQLSKITGVSEMKIERWLTYMENAQQIKQQKTNRYRIITILNWDRYQQDGQLNAQQMNNRRTTDEQQMNTNNKDKNVKKIISKDITEVETSEVLLTNKSYGNADINTLLDAISKLTPTGKLDGSEKDNRRLAYTIIRKHTLETALRALRNVKGSFYEGKINSARNLYNNFNALLNAKADTRTTDIFDLISNSYDKL